jgi:hypothetical protein
MAVCVGPPDVVAQGNPAVLINGVPVVCQGDLTAHGGVVMSGEANILISTATPSAQATMPLSQIPFPEVRLFDKLGAAITGNSANLAEAQGNIEAIQRGDAEPGEPRIYNIRWVDEKGSKLRNTKLAGKVYVAASVLNIDDGETVSFKLRMDTKDGEEIENLSGTVVNQQVKVEWIAEKRHFSELEENNEQ